MEGKNRKEQGKMRNGANVERQHTIARVNSYHHGDYRKHLIFVSDRPIETDSSYEHFIDGTNVEKALYGFEWETEAWGITDRTIYANVLRDIVFQPFHDDLWKIEADCSLNEGEVSAECITQPMTKAYIRNHYRDFKWMWEKASAFGIDCTQTGNCGMHIHISNFAFGRNRKSQEEAIRKFVYIINHHYEFFLYALHRNPNVRHYCPKMHSFDDKEYCKRFDISYQENDHYSCINMGHYDEGNIELRLVGGQKDFPCFRNTFEVVFHIMETVKTISWADCDDIVKIFSGCNQYVYNRLNTYVKEANQISERQCMQIFGTVRREQLL